MASFSKERPHGYALTQALLVKNADMSTNKVRFIGLTEEEVKEMSLLASEEEYYSGRFWAE